MQPLLIDWYCGEGGAAKGYARAGFRIIGIDRVPQPRYPYAFIQASDDEVDPRLIDLADAHHASPPCQKFTELNSKRERHADRIPFIRGVLEASGKPYTIENVRAAASELIDPVSLFGTMFGNTCTDSQGRRFVLSRERCFETNWGLLPPRDPGARGLPIANVFGGHLRVRSGEFRTGNGTGRTVDLPGEDRPALARELMGMPWATMKGMSEAVPPSYTYAIGTQLMARLQQVRAAA